LQCSAYSQRDILRIFYESTSQKSWFGGSDWNDATKPVCQMTGITCDDHENIVKIGLKNRNLSGTIPDSIGFLPFLETLDLSDNNLEGFVPSDLRWTSLTRLDISGNKLRGVLPPMLCMMQELNGNGENNVCKSLIELLVLSLRSNTHNTLRSRLLRSSSLSCKHIQCIWSSRLPWRALQTLL
jgi:hypothetical protein